MQLNGSCHCQSVKFELRSAHPYPFNYCYCSICRKTAGGGGFAINLSGEFENLVVTGQDHVSVYRARLAQVGDGDSKLSPAQRSFCKICGSALWVWDPRWPELVHPFASAIDSTLPQAPECTHIMLGSKPDWIPVNAGNNDKQFTEYPDESIAAWHERLGLNDTL